MMEEKKESEFEGLKKKGQQKRTARDCTKDRLRRAFSGPCFFRASCSRAWRDKCRKSGMAGMPGKSKRNSRTSSH